MSIKLKVSNDFPVLSIQDESLKLINPVSVIYQDNGEFYNGSYEVTPKMSRQVILSTKKKLMKDDVTVLKIPQFEVSNEAGGITLILGDEYYNG